MRNDANIATKFGLFFKIGNQYAKEFVSDGTLITPPGRMRVCARLAGCSLE